MVKARTLFAKYDTDGNGSIDKEELESIFKELGHKPSPELMRKIDPDGSGNISFMEFVNAFDIWSEILSQQGDKASEKEYKGNKVPGISLQIFFFWIEFPSKVRLTQEQIEKARHTFSKYDEDRDGQISSQELRFILSGLLEGLCSVSQAEEKAEMLMGIIDADGDGNITFMEFLKGYSLWSTVEAAEDVRRDLLEQIAKLKRTLYQTRAVKDKKLAANDNLQAEVNITKVQKKRSCANGPTIADQPGEH